jgi:hypothetical protein
MSKLNRMRGKWSKLGVPHKGWQFVRIYDCEDIGAEYGDITCEMCESEPIRYVHVMNHSSYPRELGCGCVCAGKMQEDVKTAKSREGKLKRSIAKRKREEAAAAKRERRVAIAKALTTAPLDAWAAGFVADMLRRFEMGIEPKGKQGSKFMELCRRHINHIRARVPPKP